MTLRRHPQSRSSTSDIELEEDTFCELAIAQSNQFRTGSQKYLDYVSSEEVVSTHRLFLIAISGNPEQDYSSLTRLIVQNQRNQELLSIQSSIQRPRPTYSSFRIVEIMDPIAPVPELSEEQTPNNLEEIEFTLPLSLPGAHPDEDQDLNLKMQDSNLNTGSPSNVGQEILLSPQIQGGPKGTPPGLFAGVMNFIQSKVSAKEQGEPGSSFHTAEKCSSDGSLGAIKKVEQASRKEPRVVNFDLPSGKAPLDVEFRNPRAQKTHVSGCQCLDCIGPGIIIPGVEGIGLEELSQVEEDGVPLILEDNFGGFDLQLDENLPQTYQEPEIPEKVDYSKRIYTGNQKMAALNKASKSCNASHTLGGVEAILDKLDTLHDTIEGIKVAQGIILSKLKLVEDRVAKVEDHIRTDQREGEKHLKAMETVNKYMRDISSAIQLNGQELIRIGDCNSNILHYMSTSRPDPLQPKEYPKPKTDPAEASKETSSSIPACSPADCFADNSSGNGVSYIKSYISQEKDPKRKEDLKNLALEYQKIEAKTKIKGLLFPIFVDIVEYNRRKDKKGFMEKYPQFATAVWASKIGSISKWTTAMFLEINDEIYARNNSLIKEDYLPRNPIIPQVPSVVQTVSKIPEVLDTIKDDSDYTNDPFYQMI